MNLSASEITNLTEAYEQRLSDAVKELPTEACGLEDIQDWMLRHNLEQPEVLQLLINKLGPGYLTEKKTAQNVVLS